MTEIIGILHRQYFPCLLLHTLMSLWISNQFS